MIGIIVVAHENIGKEMVEATRRIIPEADHLVSVSVRSKQTPASIREEVEEAMSSLPPHEGVLILTDMFGGTPTNICLAFLNQPQVEVISGLNLPMLIKLASMRGKTLSFAELVNFIQDYGQRNIVVASKVLVGKIDQI
ncbi:MAG: PTS sugar transporter subunit IIA [Deltaproteobacteria bacterium]|nr:PTS sugar transporter subunit IIA [Deltaproteobacteria bacterium]